MTEDKYSEEQKNLIEDYQKVFTSDAGQRVYDHLAEQSKYNKRIIPNGEITAFELGQRDMFLFIKDKMGANPNKQVQTNANPESAES